MILSISRFALLALTALGTVSATGKPLTIERLFASPSLTGQTAAAVKLSPDGRYVVYREPAQDNPDATLLWLRSTATGNTHLLLDTRKFGATDEKLSEEQMKLLERRHQVKGASLDYWWNQAGTRLLVAFNGAVYLGDVMRGAFKMLLAPEAGASDPQLAPGEQWISFLHEHNLFLYDLTSGAEYPLGNDAGETVSYGAADFIDQEEIQRFTGSWWSPDGKRLAYTRMDESDVTEVRRFRIDAAGLDLVHDRFPLAGTANADERIFIRAAPAGAAVEVDLGADRDFYIDHCAWSTDAKTFYVLRESRDHHHLDLLAADPATGSSRTLVTETNAAWIDEERDFRPLRDGQFLWGSARTGWQHLYLYDHDGRLVRAVTSGAWRVANPTVAASPDLAPIIGVDERKGIVYFIAGKDTPIEQQLYSASYRHADTPHQITQGHGWWTPAMAADNPHVFVGQYSDPSTPPQIGLYALDGHRVGWISANRLDSTHPLYPYLDQRPSYEFGSIKAADGEDLYFVVAKPAGFDASHRYPALVRVYGGPGVQMVRREWRPTSDQIYTQAGYVLFTLDNRGSANRSASFERAISGALGRTSTDDQIAGIEYLRSLPYIDPARIGMMGWSFGAYETVRTMMTPGSNVHAGVAGGTPADFHTYDTYYTERFLGKPLEHKAAYDDAGLLGRAKDLRGDLLLIHGMSDDNVSFTNFTALVTELEGLHKNFEVDVFPGQSHAIRGEAAQSRLLNDTLRFLNRSLAPESTLQQEH